MFHEGYAAVGKEDKNSKWKYGYINKRGELITGYDFSVAEPFSDGRAAVNKSYDERLFGYIDTTGKLVIDYQYFVFENFHEGLAYVVKSFGNKTEVSFIDKEGNKVIDLAALNASGAYAPGQREIRFNHGLALLEIDNRQVYINKKGEFVSPHN